MKTNTDKFGISKMWKLTKYISVFCVIMVVCIGCGQPNLDDPKVREKILAEAIEYDKLQTRKSPSGEELRYAPNQEKPYSGWVKNDSLDILDDISEDILDDISDEIQSRNNSKIRIDITYDGEMELAQYQLGKLHGFYMNWWDSNQQNFFRCALMNGKVHGLVMMWYENGQKTLEGTCKNGLMNGRWTGWHENGQKKAEGTYKNGESDGLWTEWYENGQKKAEKTYKNGKQDGLSIEWDENGQEVSRETYKDGNVVP